MLKSWRRLLYSVHIDIATLASQVYISHWASRAGALRVHLTIHDLKSAIVIGRASRHQIITRCPPIRHIVLLGVVIMGRRILLHRAIRLKSILVCIEVRSPSLFRQILLRTHSLAEFVRLVWVGDAAVTKYLHVLGGLRVGAVPANRLFRTWY